MKTGMTLKQMAAAEFWNALEAYRQALRTKTNIVGASLRVHQAKGGVPKRFHPYVNRVFREEQKHPML